MVMEDRKGALSQDLDVIYHNRSYYWIGIRFEEAACGVASWVPSVKSMKDLLLHS